MKVGVPLRRHRKPGVITTEMRVTARRLQVAA
jgi:hypothetical protein